MGVRQDASAGRDAYGRTGRLSSRHELHVSQCCGVGAAEADRATMSCRKAEMKLRSPHDQLHASAWPKTAGAPSGGLVVAERGARNLFCGNSRVTH